MGAAMRPALTRVASILLFAGAVAIACGGGKKGFPAGSSGGSSSGGGGGTGSSGGFGNIPDGGSGSSSSGGDGGTVACPQGLACNVACPAGRTTQITGTVYDPAARNPLYDVAVYVPAVPLVPLPRGVPTGSDACQCAALFKSGAISTTATGVNGTFTLDNVPVGDSVPLVLQVGKWRRSLHVPVTACQPNAQADKTLTLPGTVRLGDTDDNMPDIAVSTGQADTLECLMRRIGLPPTEYVAGTGTAGHVHVFSGGQTIQTVPPVQPGPGGLAETPSMTGAPPSPKALWASQDQLMPYDITLLSCESGETYAANPPALEAYLNAGGRVFASHFHYAWFAGPLSTGQSYTPPGDWGAGLATFSPDGDGGAESKGPIGGVVETTLNGSSVPFAKGTAMKAWLERVGALGQNGVLPGEVSIYDPRYNATVAAVNKPSQPWISADGPSGMSGATMYFSFDTPVNAPLGANGLPKYCGRAVFSDLHVGGNPGTLDAPPPPNGCFDAALSPQEKVLEFMLFDLSSCVIPDSVAPSDAGVPINQ
jgi:hypothetical protein